MKIDFIGSSLVCGGAERVMVVLANHFVEKGHGVSIITFNPPEEYELNQKIKRIKLHKGKIKNHTIRSIVSLLIYYLNKKNRPDVIISFIASTNFISIIVAKLLRIKVIASEHTNHTLVSSKVVKFTREKLYRYANITTILTKFDEEYYLKHKAKAVIVPNPSSFKKNSNTNLNSRKNVVLGVGSLNRYDEKGFENLLNIMAPILKKHPDWKLKFVGGGKGEAILKKLADNLGVYKQVIITGFRTDVDKIMADSKIFVLPSMFEGLPMVLIEAMSQGMACIAYDCVSGPSDIITHNIDGILIEDQNKDKLKKAINSLINNPIKQQKLANNALNRVDYYHVDSIYQKWESLFKTLNL